MMGETADELREQARIRGQELLERSQRAARTAMDAAKQEAQAQGFTTDSIVSKVGKVAGDVKQAAMESVRQEGLDAESLKNKAQQVGREAKEAARTEVAGQPNSGSAPAPVVTGTSSSQTGSCGCPS
jgi:hypothetical protein